MATSVTLTADMLIAEETLKLNGNSISEFTTGISEPGSNNFIPTEKAVVDYIDKTGWNDFLLNSTPTNVSQIVSSDSNLEDGLPIRFTGDNGITWDYAILYSHSGITWTVSGAPINTVAGYSYQYGNREKVQTYQFLIKSTNFNGIPSSVAGLLYNDGVVMRWINSSSVRYLVDMGVVLSNSSNNSTSKYYSPYISNDAGSTWNKVSSSSITVKSSSDYDTYGKNANYVMDVSYYKINHNDIIDFEQSFVENGTQNNVNIYITTITP